MSVPQEGSDYFEYPGFTVEYRDASHRYWIIQGDTRVPVVSVTSALKVLDKPALLDWAQKAGIEGALTLERQGELKGFQPHESAEIAPLLTLHGLGKDVKRDAGADRGTSIHRVLERWATDRTVPNLADLPAENRGYAQGLCRWLLRDHPEPSSTERVVGSVVHGFAGRMDMRAVIGGRDTIIDLKTNPKGRVYDEAHFQSVAYGLADVECGSPEPDAILIVAVGENGNFETDECQADPEQWLSVLACHRSVKALQRARAARWREHEASLKAAA